MFLPAANPTEALFRAAGQFNGLAPLDEGVFSNREHEQQIGALHRQVERLRTLKGRVSMDDALALKDEAIALLRDSLAESEAELDTLRAVLESAMVEA